MRLIIERWVGRMMLSGALVATCGAAASAQLVRGRLIDAIRGAPIPGALIELRDSAGTVRARTFSGESGAFAVIPPTRDRLALRVVAIGYAPRAATALAGDGALGDISMTPHAISLPDITALARSRGCQSIGDGDTYGKLLRAAEGALEVMHATIAARNRRFEVVETHRATIDGKVVNADSTRGFLTEWPIGNIGLDSLRDHGFAVTSRSAAGVGRMWYGPDLAVLFSDWFQERYCFTVAAMNPADSAIVIRFAPVKRSKLVELNGALHLDPLSLAVRELNYTHVHLPSGVDKGSAGGVVRFAADSTGTWIPVYWSIRAPVEMGRPRVISRTINLPRGAEIRPAASFRVPTAFVERIGRVVGEH